MAHRSRLFPDMLFRTFAGLMLSVVIITKNEAANIVRCIQSLEGLADEVLVVDSNSEDDTVALAESLGARILVQPFLGFGKQKAFAIAAATYDLVLSIDADEEVTPELRRSILEVKAQPQHGAYEITRRTNYCGHWVRHCGWYPEWRFLLFDRRQGHMREDAVHEGWEPQPGASTARLAGDLLHYSFPRVEVHFQKMNRFASIGAATDYARGKRVSLLKLWLGPKWVFFSLYILKLGFLDGYYGWLICKNSALAAWMKYSLLRELQKQKR